MYYFDEFFYDFKKNIYKKRDRKMRVVDRFLLGLSAILAFVSLMLFEVKSLNLLEINKILYIVLIAVFSLVAVIIYIYLLVKIRKENKDFDFTEFHKANVTDKIINLLKSEKYCFYNVKKIDWLILSGNKKLNEKSLFYSSLTFLKSLGSWFLPLLTLALGIIVQKFSNEQLVYYIVILIMGLAIFSWVVILLTPIIEYLSCPNKKCLEYLLGELEFIKTDIL